MAGVVSLFQNPRYCVLLVAGALSLAWPAPLPAHESPEKLINRYTVLMSEHGPSPLLLAQRAIEYRALGEFAKAAADLERALKLKPDFLSGQVELGRVYLALGKTTQALAAINRALEMVPAGEDRSTLLMTRAEAHLAAGDYDQALADSERAFQRSDINDLDWFILRGQLQARLGRWDAAISGLKEGLDRTGSAVLEAQWIEALIDAGRCGEAMEKIEPLLRESRWQSSWRLRRARARLGLGETNAATADLREAIMEINSRISADRPDITLLVDRGLAHALLGDTTAAEKDLQTARRLGAEGWLLFRLESTLAKWRKASRLP